MAIYILPVFVRQAVRCSVFHSSNPNQNWFRIFPLRHSICFVMNTRVVRGSGRPVGRVGSGQTFAVSILSCCGISKAWNDSQQLYTEQYDNR